MGDEEQKNTKKVNIFTIIVSLFAGWFGVQSKANRERDFEYGKPHHFIIGGIIFAVLFILAVVGIVKIVMSTAGV